MKPTIPDQVAAQLRGDILSGTYAPGDRLPPERTLSVSMNTNRNTLREAVRTLEQLGLVRARQGDGVRVLDFRRDGRLDLLPDFLAADVVPLPERLQVLADVLRMRLVFLGEAAAQAAARRTDADVVRLRLAAPDLTAETELARAVASDLAFYSALVDAAHSQVAAWTLNTFSRVLKRVLDALPRLWILPAEYPRTQAAVIDAIASGDAQAAREAVRIHLESSDAAVAGAMLAATNGGMT